MEKTSVFSSFRPSATRRWKRRRHSLLSRLAARLTATIGRESAAGRIELWLPVGFAAGIALYFAAAVEPPFDLRLSSAIAAAGAAAVVMLHRRGMTAQAAIALALLTPTLGFLTAQFHAHRATAPKLTERLWRVAIEGQVIAVAPRDGGRHAVTIVPVALGDLAADRLPRRIRVTMRGEAPPLGSDIRLPASLYPPSGPAAPGDFDPARKAWFAGIGGYGYAVGAVEVLPSRHPPPLSVRLRLSVETLRLAAARRIGELAPGDAGGVAIALLTGFRGSISPDATAAFRASGLAHLLAISGLHMGIVAGSFYFATRAFLALFSRLALSFDIRKGAACCAAAATVFYLGLSGGAASGLRAALMVGLALTAILLNRLSLTMRAVALAATAMLMLRPDFLVAPGFQMSFAATIGLIAFFERRDPAAQSASQRLPARSRSDATPRTPIAASFRRLYEGMAVTIIASAATAPFILYHFNRLALYGVVANLPAVALTAFAVLPAGFIGLALMPFGWDAPAFALMTAGIEPILAIAATVSQWPHATLATPTPTVAALCLSTLGFLWLCLWRRPWRRWGFVLIAAAALTPHPPSPDLLIAADGRQAAVRGDDGLLHTLDARRHAYETARWLRRDGDRRSPAEAAGGGFFRCDDLGCVAPLPGGGLLTYAHSLDALPEDCRIAEIAVTPHRNAAPCQGPQAFIDGDATAKDGALAFIRDKQGTWRRLSARERRGQRLWTP